MHCVCSGSGPLKLTRCRRLSSEAARRPLEAAGCREAVGSTLEEAVGCAPEGREGRGDCRCDRELL